MKRGLTFDDVALVPNFSSIKSRTEPELTTFIAENYPMEIPIIPANMDCVIGEELGEIIIKNGGIPIFHRFASLSEQQKWINKFPLCPFLSAGYNNAEKIAKLKPHGICIDVAHGHTEQMLNIIDKIKNIDPEIRVIAGNICTAKAAKELTLAGADAIKVGIGPGAACTTRIVTGFGVPQFTAIQECARATSIPIIADGGIKNSGDILKALAAGASSVMIGKLFAFTKESAAKKRGLGLEANYRGQASRAFQEDFYGEMKEGTVAEGIDFWAPVSGPAQGLIDELLGGIRAGLSYAGAKNINELAVDVVEVNPSYQKESEPRT